MKIIFKTRRAGKTYDILMECAKNNGRMVCSCINEVKRVKEVAKHNGLSIKEPITFDSIRNNSHLGLEDALYIDNADDLLRVIVRSKIGCISINNGE